MRTLFAVELILLAASGPCGVVAVIEYTAIHNGALCIQWQAIVLVIAAIFAQVGSLIIRDYRNNHGMQFDHEKKRNA